jgi:DNA-binding CsgD family transcriptional regulator
MTAVLYGRRAHCELLDRLLAELQGGNSAGLLVLGEAGAGKTALLDYAVQAAVGLRVASAAGVESEMELAYAGLRQLCEPMLDRLEQLPGPQRAALETAFGLDAGPVPDRFLVGLAVLSLLSEAARERPLVTVVDDAQWLDRASAQALAFAARRLRAESVLMIFAAREPGVDLRGLPELMVEGLRDADARALLNSAVRWPLDDRVADRIVAETGGNPLALLELPRGLSPAQLAGGFGWPGAALPDRIEDSFLRRIEGLPADARLLLVVAAAETGGDPVLVRRAADRLGLSMQAADHAVAAGLLDLGIRLRFRHPLVRSAAYGTASPADRQRVHAALAEVIDPHLDPDRRAWHRAQAISDPDEEVAEELEQSAGRAQARGGLAAAAAFLQRSAGLTDDPGRRAARALAAAQAKAQAGAADEAIELLALAEAGPADEFLGARIGLLRGQMAFASGQSAQASRLLLETARQLERLDPRLARETYLDALNAAMFVGRLADAAGLPEVAASARRAPAAPQPPRACDLLLDGLSLLIMDGYEVGAPVVRQAVTAFRDGDLAIEEEMRWFFAACRSAHDLWDDEGYDALSARYVTLTRGSGALAALPLVLTQRIGLLLHAGEFGTAASLVDEIDAIAHATGYPLPPYGALAVAAWRGRAAEATPLIDAAVISTTARGEGMGLSLVHYTDAVLNNGLGRYRDALTAAERASAYPQELGFANWALPELVEAAARCGETGRAVAAAEQLTLTTRPSGTPWGLGIEARSRALLSEGDEAELLYQEAIERLRQSRGAVALARAHLVYGEWLRRANRAADAPVQLRTAYQMFASIGAEAFAERARRELAATGETIRERTVETRDELTAQERQIAWRARDGYTNAEIGAELLLSARTVEWHLRKIFGKLGISSRKELGDVLPDSGRQARSA